MVGHSSLISALLREKTKHPAKEKDIKSDDDDEDAYLDDLFASDSD